MSLHRPGPILDGIRDHLDVLLPDHITVEVDAGEWEVDQVIVELVYGPVATSIHWGGHDFARIDVQLTCTAPDRNAVRKLGDLARERLVEQDRHGVPVHPLIVPGFTVNPIETNGDGAATTGNPSTWTETYQVHYQTA